MVTAQAVQRHQHPGVLRRGRLTEHVGRVGHRPARAHPAPGGGDEAAGDQPTGPRVGHPAGIPVEAEAAAHRPSSREHALLDAGADRDGSGGTDPGRSQEQGAPRRAPWPPGPWGPRRPVEHGQSWIRANGRAASSS